jgi:4-aminobutyrate aminotransferase
MLSTPLFHGETTTNTSWIGPAPWIVTPPPGPLALHAEARDLHVCYPCQSTPLPLVVRRAQGSVVEDVDGNRYLDFTAGGGVSGAGHCHPRVLKAVELQTRQALHMTGGDVHHAAISHLADKLTRLAPGEGLKRVCLTTCGPAAIETASQLVRSYTGRQLIIGFESPERTDPMRPSGPNVRYLPYGDVRAFRSSLRKDIDPADVAGIFVEPIDGASGREPTANFLPTLRACCDEYEIVLVMDETGLGMGRTGALFAYEHQSVIPDMLLLGTGLSMPVGAVMMPASITSRSPEMAPCMANPVACAAALATIELLEKQYTRNAEMLHATALHKLKEIASNHKNVGNPRGLGLFITIDVIRDHRSHAAEPGLRDRIVAEAFTRGLLVQATGKSCIRIAPPLSINRVQIEVGLDVFEEAIATVAV